MNNIFIQLAIILGLSSIIGFITYKFKLPLLIAYLFVGLILAFSLFLNIRESEALTFLPEIGIAFMLFLVGMELDLRELKSFGKPIIIAGILQIIITTVFGTFIAQSFGFGLVEAIYLGVGLSFSSTIVVVKLLGEKKDLNSLYGKLTLGILLLEDLLAVVILLALTSQTSALGMGVTQAFPVLAFMGKVLIILTLALLLNHYILGTVFKAVSGSGELLFLTALAWCFIYTSFAQILGFSILIGAFLAGVALANSPYHYQIQGKVKPVRDFFVTLFFVYLGTRVDFSLIGQTFPLILFFTFYALALKPIIFLLIFGGFGFRKHTMFQAAINLSQISEFSLIILLVGVKEGLTTPAGLTVIASSGVLSIFISSLMISKSSQIYKVVMSAIGFFERNPRHFSEKGEPDHLENHIVVIGAHRVGGEIVKFLKREKLPMVVLDFNPHLVEALLSQNIPVIYGDMEDPEVLDILNLDKAKMIISTSPDTEDNQTLLEDLQTRHINVPTIVRAEGIMEAASLYKSGADYVLIPEVLAGDLLLQMLKDHLEDRTYFKDRPRIELDKLHRKTLAWE